jgi:hypothetical protein
VRRHFHRRPDGSARSWFFRWRLDLLRAKTFAGVGGVAGFFSAEAKPCCPSLQTDRLYGYLTSSPGAVVFADVLPALLNWVKAQGCRTAKLPSLQPVHFASYQLAAGVPPFCAHS